MISRENIDSGNGYVHVVWDRNSTMSDYPRDVYIPVTLYDESSWPIRINIIHICGLSYRKFAVVKSNFYDEARYKRPRRRTLFHDVPDGKLIDTLSEHGILRHMLPTEMGGSYDLDQSRWIGMRRTIEMEEE